MSHEFVMLEHRGPIGELTLNRPDVVNQCVNVDTETGGNFERLGQSALKLTADHQEGRTAFVEKRKPKFEGR